MYSNNRRRSSLVATAWASGDDQSTPPPESSQTLLSQLHFTVADLAVTKVLQVVLLQRELGKIRKGRRVGELLDLETRGGLE